MLGCLNEASPMSNKVMPSLRLSYEALANHLKACFVFLKNTEINLEYSVYVLSSQEFASSEVPVE